MVSLSLLYLDYNKDKSHMWFFIFLPQLKYIYFIDMDMAITVIEIYTHLLSETLMKAPIFHQKKSLLQITVNP